MSSQGYINRISVFMPNAPVGNDQMESILGMVHGKPSRARRMVLRSNGIETRYYAIDPATGKATHNNAQLTAEAVRKLEGDGFNLEDMDLLACGTTMAGQLMPNHAVMVHGELGSKPIEVVATAGICLSGVAAMKYAWMGVRSGEFKKAVATGSENPSSLMRARYFDEEIEARVKAMEAKPEIAFEKDFLRWMLSDGAGAVLLEPKPSKAGLCLRIDWIVERSFANEMDVCMYAGAEKLDDGRFRGWLETEPREWLERSIFNIKQDVKLLNEHVMPYTVTRGIQEALKLHPMAPGDVDFFLPHYSSHYFRQRAYDALVAAKFEIPYEKWFTNLASKGNTGSASIYIILEELLHSGRLKPGHRLLCYVPESGRFSTGFLHLTVCAPA